MSSNGEGQQTTGGLKIRLKASEPFPPPVNIAAAPSNEEASKKRKKEKKEKKDKKEKKARHKEKKEKKERRKEASQNNNTNHVIPVQAQPDPVDLDASDDDVVAVPKQARMSLSEKTEHEGQKKEFYDFSQLKLKPDHEKKPLWICPDGHIFLETFSPIYNKAYDFLVAISEPECRSYLMHEYQLTPYSLYGAVSVGLTTEQVIDSLEKLSKVSLTENIKKFIKDCTESFGKVKLVLQRNRYFLESIYPHVLQRLLKDETIAAARLTRTMDGDNNLATSIDPNTGFTVSKITTGPVQISGVSVATTGNDGVVRDGLDAKLALEDELDERVEQQQHEVHSFELDPQHVEAVKKKCIQLEYPTLEEYDFRNDIINTDLNIDLKPATKIRPYQEKSLSKMFGNGRARSGIIVLACGAGKTLVGITAACTVKKSCLVLCTSGVSVTQWRNQFLMWSEIEDKEIVKFTSDEKEIFKTESGIVVSTYTMIAYGGKRSEQSEKVMRELRSREWGLVILDEVHVVPAAMFRRVLTEIKAHCKLGLTATLVREDDLVDDLNFLIGPKLYEANWIDLQRAGHIATVQCIEVWCSMAPQFYREYLNQEASRPRKNLLCIMNPTKFRYCEFLIKQHEARGDKIIVFSDNIYALEHYAKKLGKPYIYGPTSNIERERVLDQFRWNPNVKTIFISKVGDTSIDIPNATVIIQVSSNFGSRRQEAQRLGRISRPKPDARTEDQNNAFFYSLISKDTHEMYFSSKRQQFLVDQGYAFKVLSELPIHEDKSLHYGTKESQLTLLSEVLALDETLGNEEEASGDPDDLKNGVAAARRTQGGRGLSGAGGSYSERKTIFNAQPAKHQLFTKTKKR
ncbi:transcription factor IIH subunit [Planoprotostelium fungivorum]|uniref:DNA 3'-5' helicase n=1 Tax=Planoprotostelium fungivorum TaxID=1890364 RepID=A0A2P6NVB0_9EUKA|nr:transcription factor IIH subunit [Planoprotostelium fungivorum]